MMRGVLQRELRFSGLETLNFTLRHALRGMLASHMFERSAGGGVLWVIGAWNHAGEAEEEAQEVVVLEEDDHALEAFAYDYDAAARCCL
jgi:hypothetical protein